MTNNRRVGRRELYYFDQDGLDHSGDHPIEQLKLTTINQTWFKLLAIISFLCALIVYAALIWLIVCRPNRLPKTDEEIKKEGLISYRRRKKLKQCNRRDHVDFKRRLKYLLFGRMRVRSPSFASYSSDDEDDVERRNLNKKAADSKVNVKTVKEKTSKKKSNK